MSAEKRKRRRPFTGQWSSTAVDSNAAIRKLWNSRSNLNPVELRGLINFLYLAAASHFEGFIAGLLRWRLFLPTETLKSKTVLPSHTIKTGTVAVGSRATTEIFPLNQSSSEMKSMLIKMDEEQKAIVRILDEWLSDLETAPFTKLDRAYRCVTDSSLSADLENKLFGRIKGLFDIRNVVAHGRDLFINFNSEWPPTVCLDGHPLSNVIQIFQESGLFTSDIKKPLAASELLQLFSSEAAGILFYNAVGNAERTLLKKPFFEKVPVGFCLSPLEPLNSQTL